MYLEALDDFFKEVGIHDYADNKIPDRFLGNLTHWTNLKPTSKIVTINMFGITYWPTEQIVIAVLCWSKYVHTELSYAILFTFSHSLFHNPFLNCQ